MASLQVKPSAMMAAGDIQPSHKSVLLSRFDSSPELALGIHSIAHPKAEDREGRPRPTLDRSDIGVDIGPAVFVGKGRLFLG